MEKWLKIKAMFQSILEPIQSQTKEAFVATICAINQRTVLFAAMTRKPWEIIQI